MMRKAKAIVAVCVLLLLLQGCWGAQETDQLGYILAMGIDKGEENIVKVTFQLAIPQAITGGGGEEGTQATEVISIEAASLFGAQELANAFVSKHLTLIHNNTVIVSEEVAREGLSKYINPLVRSRDFRRTNYLMVTKGKASDFIEKNKLIFEKYPSRQMDIFMSTADITGFICRTDIHSFYQGLKSPGRQPVTALAAVQKEEGEEETQDNGQAEQAQDKGQEAEQGSEQKGEARGRVAEEEAQDQNRQAKEQEKEQKRGNREKTREEVAYFAGEIPRKGGNKIEVIGQAVFRADQLVGFLNGRETRYYQMVTGDFKKGTFTFPEPENPENEIIVMGINKGRSPEVTVKNLKSGHPVIEVNLNLEGEILSIQSGLNYETGELEKKLEDYLSGHISQGVTEVIRKTQVEFQSDIFGFGEYTRTFFWTWEEWVNYKWHEQYPECEIRVKTIFNIRRTGMMAKTATETS